MAVPFTRTVKEICSMVEHFKAVPDFRGRFESYPLWSMLTILFFNHALRCSAREKDIAKFARGLSQAQRRALGIRPNPISPEHKETDAQNSKPGWITPIRDGFAPSGAFVQSILSPPPRRPPFDKFGLEMLYSEAIQQWQKHVTGMRPVSAGLTMRLMISSVTLLASAMFVISLRRSAKVSLL